MQDDVGVTMPRQAARMFDAQAAENEGPAGFETVRIVADADAHGILPVGMIDDCSDRAKNVKDEPVRSCEAAWIVRRRVHEAHELLLVVQGHLAGRPVALLVDDDLDDALMLPRLV